MRNDVELHDEFPAVKAVALFLLLSVSGVPAAVAQDCGSNEPLPQKDSVWDVAAKWDGVEAYVSPSRSADVSRRLAFASSFRVYNERGGWLCLGNTEDGGFVGWVPRNDLLVTKDAQKHQGTGVYIKVMVANNLEARSTEEWGRFWSHPERRSGSARRGAGLYEVRYVFDVKSVMREGKPRYAYLAGSGQNWNIDNAGTILDGWIAADFVFVWTTRVGVQYATGLEQVVKVYPERDDLDSVHCEGEPIGWAFSSVDDDPEWPYDRERFPVISEAPGTGCLDKRRVLEIGGFGTVVLNDEELSASQGDHLLSTVNSLRGGNQNIDILFVIDGTESMKPVFEEAKRAVQQVKGQGALAEARYALAMFKDRSSSWPPRMTTRLLDAAALSRELDLYMEEVQGDTDRNFAESVLDGLQFGLSRMAEGPLWRENSTRAVILLGDHGDHGDIDHGERLRGVVESLKQQKVRFFAYQTRNTRPNNERAITSYNGFKEDGTDIIDAMVELFPTRVPVAHGDAEQITQAFQEMRRWRSEIDGGYDAVRNGEVPPSEVGPYIERMLKDSGLTLQQVMGYGRAPQVCHSGFAVLEDKGGREQFEKRLRISYSDIARLTVAFRDFLSDVSSEARVLRAMLTAFQAATGDSPIKDETPAEFLKRTLGIDVASELLTQSFEELAAVLFNNRSVRKQLRADLDRSVTLLDSVYREEQVRVRRDGTVEVVMPSKRRPWFKVLPDGVRVAWIPTSYIP